MFQEVSFRGNVHKIKIAAASNCRTHTTLCTQLTLIYLNDIRNQRVALTFRANFVYCTES